MSESQDAGQQEDATGWDCGKVALLALGLGWVLEQGLPLLVRRTLLMPWTLTAWVTPLAARAVARRARSCKAPGSLQ